MQHSKRVTNLDILNNTYGTDNEEYPTYKLKMVEFDTNMTDLIVTPTAIGDSSLASGDFRGKKSKYEELTEEEKAAENLQRSIRRARQQTQYKVRQIGANHLLTLTTRDILTDDEFKAAFNRFCRLVREKKYVNGKLVAVKDKQPWSYVAVPELQERGAWHIHLAVVGKQDLNFLRACWYVALGGNEDDSGSDTKGNIDVQSRKKRFSGSSKVFRVMQLVQYLTKYIAKSFEQNQTLGTARYKAARHIKPPRVDYRFLMTTACDLKDQFINAMKETIAIAREQGLTDFEIFNVGTDVFVLRGMFDENSLFR